MGNGLWTSKSLEEGQEQLPSAWKLQILASRAASTTRENEMEAKPLTPLPIPSQDITASLGDTAFETAKVSQRN